MATASTTASLFLSLRWHEFLAAGLAMTWRHMVSRLRASMRRVYPLMSTPMSLQVKLTLVPTGLIQRHPSSCVSFDVRAESLLMKRSIQVSTSTKQNGRGTWPANYQAAEKLHFRMDLRKVLKYDGRPSCWRTRCAAQTPNSPTCSVTCRPNSEFLKIIRFVRYA